MDNNFMDEDDAEEIFDDSDAIEIDDRFLLTAGHLFFSEESNNTTENEAAASPSASGTAIDARLNDATRVNLTSEQLKLLNDFSLEQYSKVIKPKKK
jgi:hypothetical protein